jgi:putative ABC transport system permease protein
LLKLKPLQRKLLRDVWHMRGQALAIAMVVMAGVAMLVMYFSTFDSLQRTLDTYYERHRFADVFASARRAPRRLEERAALLPGVAAVETRVVADVTLDVPDMTEPAIGRLVSVPADSRPRLNGVVLRRGRWIEPGRPDEVIASEPFADAHRLQPGDRLSAVINGRHRTLRIVGLGLSPEYVYTIPPGEVIPDDKRFAILWMERRALASAFDMEGGFNDVVLALTRGASSAEVITRLDRLLEPYGAAGAIPRDLQPSHWALVNELRQIRTFGVIVPLIFLGIAAFLLNIALTRALALQRAQIAALKALGYHNTEIGWHYLQWALLIAALGALLGVAVGAWLGSGMINLYNQFFRFPDLLYRLSTGVAVAGVLVALAAGGLGAVFAVRHAVRVPPAEAMRPEPPARYRRSFVERPAVQRRLTHATRMVLRNLERQPARAAATVVGIAFAIAILLFGFVFLDVMDHLADVQFSLVQRQDVTVAFVLPASSSALFDLRSLPGVMHAEPYRSVPARIRSGHHSRTLPLTGIRPEPQLSRIVDLAGRPVRLPPSGLVISRMLGEILAVRPGDTVTVEVLDGARPVLRVPVAALVDDALGLNAWMDIKAMHALLREGGTLSGAHLMVDPSRSAALYTRLKALPAVGAVSVTAAALDSFRRVTSQNFAIITTFNVGFAVIIAFGVVYNAARISLSERTRELASLRVLGFTIAEISLILLGELALLTLLAIPIGLSIGWGLSLMMLVFMNNEFYRFPLLLTADNVAVSTLILLAAAFLSGLAVRRKLDHLDLVAVLKMRE